VLGQGADRVYRDVLVGDVWLCSGQSNMGMGLGSMQTAKTDIAAAKLPSVRQFSKKLDYAPEPVDRNEGSWTVCTPETAGGFSAAAFYFARSLQPKINVPIGLINSSWGATNAEQWISLDGFLALSDLASVKLYRKALTDYKSAEAEYLKKYAEWEHRTFTVDPGNKGFGLGWAKPDFTDGGWKTMNLPVPWETQPGMIIDGAVWFRKQVDLPGDWAGKNLVLSLGSIDDFDVTYFNNVPIGSTGQKTPEWHKFFRKYAVPGKLVQAGRNVITVRVFDRWKDGGFTGTPEQMSLALAVASSKSIPLAGPWKFDIEYRRDTEPEQPMPVGPSGPGNIYSPGAIYNAMIHPLTPMAIRGVLWYQGENNVYRYQEYARLLAGLIVDWQRRWNRPNLPFLVIQLPNYENPSAEPSDPNLAHLREAQVEAVRASRNAALIVGIDTNPITDCHSPVKAPIGERSAAAALKVAYGQNVAYSGPVFKSARREGSKVRLTFDFADSGLVTPKNEPVKGFALAGVDGKYFWATAKIDGATIVLSCEKVVHPVAVRYAWGANPPANLYNRENFPAVPFGGKVGE